MKVRGKTMDSYSLDAVNYTMHPHLEEIQEAARGLLFVSETEHAFEPFEIKSLDGSSLRELAEAPAHAGIEETTLPHFFRNMTRTYPGDPEKELLRAARFGSLQQLLESRLEDIRVYRVGMIQVTAIIAGKLGNGHVGGLITKLVET